MIKTELGAFAREDLFDLIGSRWMLVTAGGKDGFNTMTASWGGAGWLWNKPVAFVFIRPERYTHEFIERGERLTLSFYDESMRPALQLCGKKSGRDTDKAREAGLSPVVLESGAVTFAQAKLTLDCRKLFKAPLPEAGFIDKTILERWYGNQPGGSLHDLYICEIENLYSEEN